MHIIYEASYICGTVELLMYSMHTIIHILKSSMHTVVRRLPHEEIQNLRIYIFEINEKNFYNFNNPHTVQ